MRVWAVNGTKVPPRGVPPVTTLRVSVTSVTIDRPSGVSSATLPR